LGSEGRTESGRLIVDPRHGVDLHDPYISVASRLGVMLAKRCMEQASSFAKASEGHVLVTYYE